MSLFNTYLKKVYHEENDSDNQTCPNCGKASSLNGNMNNNEWTCPFCHQIANLQSLKSETNKPVNDPFTDAMKIGRPMQDIKIEKDPFDISDPTDKLLASINPDDIPKPEKRSPEEEAKYQEQLKKGWAMRRSEDERRRRLQQQRDQQRQMVSRY